MFLRFSASMVSFKVSTSEVEWSMALRTDLGSAFKITYWHPTRSCEWSAFEKGAKAPDFLELEVKQCLRYLTAFTFPG